MLKRMATAGCLAAACVAAQAAVFQNGGVDQTIALTAAPPGGATQINLPTITSSQSFDDSATHNLDLHDAGIATTMGGDLLSSRATARLSAADTDFFRVVGEPVGVAHTEVSAAFSLLAPTTVNFHFDAALLWGASITANPSWLSMSFSSGANVLSSLSSAAVYDVDGPQASFVVDKTFALAAGDYHIDYALTSRYPTYGFDGPSTGGFSVSAVPEPATLALLAVGLGGLAFVRRKRAAQ